MNKVTIYLAYNEKIDEKELSATLKKVAIADYLGDAEVTYDGRGKPIITTPAGYFISVSHSSHLCAVALGNTPLGVDLERRGEKDRARLREKFFHEDERELDFFDTWVKKEAFGKLQGDGVFALRGKSLPTGIIFYDFKKEASALAGQDFSASLATESTALVSIAIRRDL